MINERLAALALTLFLAFAALVPTSRPAEAQQFIASQIENLISTDTMKVKIDGLSGALTGAIRIEKVTVSDPQGVFLTASDLAMDWSPLALTTVLLSDVTDSAFTYSSGPASSVKVTSRAPRCRTSRRRG